MIYVIGIGIRGRESLSGEAERLIKKAGLLAGGRRHLGLFPESEARKVTIGADLEALASGIKAFKGTAVVLATGDPMLYGIGDFIVKRFGKAGVRVMPNVSTVQEAFARTKESANGVKVLSVHGRSGDSRGIEGLCASVIGQERVAIFTDSVNTPAKIASALIESNSPDYKVYVCESLGAENERIRGGTLKSVSRMRGFHPLNTMLLIKKDVPRPRKTKNFGIPDALFSHSSNMITKEEIRVVVLSKLGLGPHDVVWDIGACSGSVAIEAARLVPMGRVFAVEKNRGRIKDVLKNKKRFSVTNMEAVEGTAPGCLDRLPAPDAVFVGGGGKGLAGILECASKRLEEGGRMVVNAVTIESANAAFAFMEKGWSRELVIVGLTKAKGVGDLNLLKADNPVFIISGVKK